MDYASYNSRQMSRYPGVSSTKTKTFNVQKSYICDNLCVEQWHHYIFNAVEFLGHKFKSRASFKNISSHLLSTLFHVQF